MVGEPKERKQGEPIKGKPSKGTKGRKAQRVIFYPVWTLKEVRQWKN
nr:MAG TPA: hypothetical protein [Caudoviricetes sp.]